MKTRFALSVLAAVILFASGAAWVSRASAQTTLPLPPTPVQNWTMTVAPDGTTAIRGKTIEPTVLSGPDVGIRVTGMKSGQVFGTLVVRVDGKWKAVQTVGTDMTVGR
jgi:hypothetical protein